MKSRLLILSLLLVALASGALAWLFGTEAGLLWSYQRLKDRLPETLQAGRVQGRMIGPLSIDNLAYRDDRTDARLTGLVIDWNPAALLSGSLQVTEIHADNLSLSSTQGAASPVSEAPTSFHFSGIRLPLKLVIQRLRVNDVLLSSAEQSTRLEQVEMKLAVDQKRLEVDAKLQQNPTNWLTLVGSTRLDSSLAHDLQLAWKFQVPSRGDLGGFGRISGDVDRSSLVQQINGIVSATLSLDVDKPLDALHWQTRLQLQDFNSDIVFPGLPSARGSIALTARGDLQRATIDGKLGLTESPAGPLDSEFHIGDILLGTDNPLRDTRWRGSARLSSFDSTRVDASLPVARGRVRLNAQGDLQQASANGRLELEESPAGSLAGDFKLQALRLNEERSGILFDAFTLQLSDAVIDVSGQFDWLPVQAWQARVTARDFNPGFIAPDWPGRLNAQLLLSGRSDAGSPAVQVDVTELSGNLRDYPVAASGSASWQNSRASLRKVQLFSGSSRIQVSGDVGDSLNLDWSIDSPHLDEVLAGASGALQAEGKLQGEQQKAMFSARLNGSQLAYQSISVGSLNSTVTTELDLRDIVAGMSLPPKRFSLQAENVLLEDYSLRQLNLQSDGQTMVAEIDAIDGAARFEMVGEMRDRQWLGTLDRARILHRDYGSWTLTTPASLAIQADAVELAESCLVNPDNGNLCLTFSQKAQRSVSTFQLRKLPLALAQPWLRDDMVLTGYGNIQGDISYSSQQGVTGHIEFDLSQGTLGYRSAMDVPQEIDYRGVTGSAVLSSRGLRAELQAVIDSKDRISVIANLPGATLPFADPASQAVEATVEASLSKLDPVAAELPQIERLRGETEAKLVIGGTLGDPVITGEARLRNASLYLPRLDLEVDQLEINIQGSQPRQVEYLASALVANGRMTVNGRSSLDPEKGWPTRVGAHGDNLQMVSLLKPWLPVDLDIDGSMGFTATADFQYANQFSSIVQLQLPAGRIRYPLSGRGMDEWSYAPATATLEIRDNRATLETGLRIGGNTAQAAFRIDQFDLFDFQVGNQPLRGQLDIDVSDLTLVEIFVPGIQRPQGNLRTSISLNGTLAEPALHGSAELQEGRLQISRLGLTLGNIAVDASTNADGLTRLSGRLQSGEGELRFDGSIQLDAEKGWPAAFELSGSDIEVIKIPEAQVIASPDLTLAFSNRDIRVTGSVAIPFARLRPRDLTSAAQVSRDAVMVDAESVESSRWNIQSRVRFVLGERVEFYGYGFECRLDGNLVVEESPGKPTLGTGEIRIIDGRYRAYGQYLNIDEGRLLFSGSPLANPGLDMRAVRQAGDVIAGVKVSGRLRNPRLDLYSVPAMGQTDTLSYLLTGGPLETATSGEGATMANAALALGLSGGDRIARSIGDQFGIDEMRVESSQNGDQASLVLGRYLSPRLYLGYGVGLIEPVNTLNLRYRIAEQWQLEAESGEHQGVDLIYGFER